MQRGRDQWEQVPLPAHQAREDRVGSEANQVQARKPLTTPLVWGDGLQVSCS